MLVKLQLQSTPRQVYFPGLRRELEEIAPDLREKIRAAVNGEVPWPLFIHGASGLGKTCAALCVVDRCYKKEEFYRMGNREFGRWLGSTAAYYTAEQVCTTIMHARTKAKGMWEDWRNHGLFVLDELGAREKASDFAYNTLKQLVDERQGVPFIAISNLDLAGLANCYDDRISSRLGAGTVVKVDGEDRRLKHHKIAASAQIS